MKKIFPILLLSLFAFQACKKETKGTDSLTGKWKLTLIYNNVLSAPLPRPADARGDFIITFNNNNTFSGNTFRNTFNEGSYTLTNKEELRFGGCNSTKIAEDAWGNNFNRVLIACLLQSLAPCTPSIIHVQNNELTITTPNYSTLIFERVQ